MPHANLTNEIVADFGTPERTVELRDTKLQGLILRVRPTGRKVFELVSERGGHRWSRKLGIWPHMTVKVAREAAIRILGDATRQEHFPERSKGRHTLREFSVRYFQRWILRAEDEARRCLNSDWAELLDKPLREIRREKIDEIRARWIKSGLAPATINRRSTVLRSVLSRAVEWGELKDHPMRTMPNGEKGIPGLKVDGDERARTLTDAERGRLYGVIDAGECAADIGTGVYILLNTGARLGELRGLRTEDVDLKNNTIRIRATTSKVAKSRSVPINATLAARLATHRDFVAPSRGFWRSLMNKAHVQAFTPHHTRHDFLSRLANSGVPMHVVSKLAGHSSIELTARYYTHSDEAAYRAAVERV